MVVGGVAVELCDDSVGEVGGVVVGVCHGSENLSPRNNSNLEFTPAPSSLYLVSLIISIPQV